MYLYFGIRTINQTRQVEQFCSLQKNYENKNNYHNIQILITYLLLIIITVAVLYFEIYLYFEKLVWSSKRMISILMKKVVFSPFMLYIPTWSDLQLYQPLHAWHIFIYMYTGTNSKNKNINISCQNSEVQVCMWHQFTVY